MENLEKRTGITHTSITNSIEETKERISDIEDTIEEIDTLVKENVKSKTFLTQDIQEIWDSMKIPRLRKIPIKEGNFQLKAPENIF